MTRHHHRSSIIRSSRVESVVIARCTPLGPLEYVEKRNCWVHWRTRRSSRAVLDIIPQLAIRQPIYYCNETFSPTDLVARTHPKTPSTTPSLEDGLSIGINSLLSNTRLSTHIRSPRSRIQRLASTKTGKDVVRKVFGAVRTGLCS